MSTKSFFKILALALGAAIATGCGNAGQQGSRQSLRSDTYGTASALTAPGDFRCTGQRNILPYVDHQMNGSYEFEACVSASSIQKVLLDPYTERDRELCALPVQYISRDRVYAKPGPDLLPIYQCGKAGVAGLSLEFPNVNFNGLAVVARADLAALRACLASNYLAGCPADWSVGQFRP